jgi:NADH-quinone oxidoreductase subunit D
MSLDLSEPIAAAAERTEQEYLWTLNFGPQHPATHTTLRLILKLDGERVVDAIPDIGFLHSGFEKLGEHLDYNQYVTITDRMNYISPGANNIAWHMAVEKLLDLELTPRCKYIRVILAELSRIADHLLCVGAAALDLGALTAFLYAFNQRELIYQIQECMAGQRFFPSYTRVGGLMYDVDEQFVRLVRDFLDQFPRVHDDLVRLLNRNRIFVDRTKGVGVLSREDAINWSCSGPIARASGVTRDLRRDEPYLCYSDFDFMVACSTGGDAYARYLVRMAEMLESLKIVRQAIENLPAGPVNVDVATRVMLPAKPRVYSTIEGLIQHFEVIMTNRGFTTPREECYTATESPNGELGFYIVGNGSMRAYRARCRPPSFVHFAIFPLLIRGHTISDVVAVLGSLNIIAAELDR